MRTLTILILLLVTACTSNNLLEYETLTLPPQEELTYTTVVRNIPAKYVMNLFITDSVFIVAGNDQESFFFAYDKKTGKHLKNFLKIGRGPFEGVSPFLLAINGDSCVITESNLRKGWSLSLSGLLQGKSDFYREFRFQFPKERPQMMASDVVNLGENRYIIPIPFTATERFAIITNPYSTGEKSVKHIYTKYPHITPDADSVNAAILNYINQFTLSPDRTKFVTLSYLGAIAETFQFQKDTLIPLAIKGFIKPEYHVARFGAHPKTDAMMGFSSVITSNEYFYTIYHNHRYNTPSDKDVRTIAVFDWKINLVKSYKIKDLLFKMKLDPATNIVYGLIRNQETLEYDIVKFDKQFIE